MTILSDISIRALCNKPVASYKDILAEVSSDPELVALVGSDSFGKPLPERELTSALEHEADLRFHDQDFGMIYPYEPTLVRVVVPEPIKGRCVVSGDDANHHWTYPDPRKIISKGSTSYGYDVSLAADGIKIFTDINATEIDPKRFNANCLADAVIRTDRDGAKYFLMPPRSYALGRTVEHFNMPRDVIAVCLGKSTYARAGAIVNVTPLEPGWHGYVVIEISNSASLPLRIYLEEGISQFLFIRGDQPCETSYSDRGGKYQGQSGVTLPKV